MSASTNSSTSGPTDAQQNKLNEVMVTLSGQLDTLRELLSESYINSGAEANAHSVAEQTAASLERMRQVTNAPPDSVADLIVEFERLSTLFNQRVADYERRSLLERTFQTPRTRFRNAWAQEEALSPRSQAAPEVAFLTIVLAVFAVLLVAVAFTGSGPAMGSISLPAGVKKINFKSFVDGMNGLPVQKGINEATQFLRLKKQSLFNVTSSFVSKIYPNFNHMNNSLQNSTIYKTEL